MAITLYGLSTCPYCRMARKLLEDNNVEFTLVEVDKLAGPEREAAVTAVKERTGGKSFPVLMTEDDFVVGFNKVKISEIAGI